MNVTQTLLNLDEDILQVITAMASVQDRSAGEIVSALVRKSLLSPDYEVSPEKLMSERMRIELENTRHDIEMRELSARIRLECSCEIETLSQQKKELEEELYRSKRLSENLVNRLKGSQAKSKRLLKKLQPHSLLYCELLG